LSFLETYFFLVFGLAVAPVGLGFPPAVGAGIGTELSSASISYWDKSYF